MKAISCGTLIKDNNGNFLACHPTGQSKNNGHWDIPKGHLEKDENILECAIRECKEETGFDLSDYKDKMRYVGHFNYTPEKDLVLFYVEIDSIPIETLKCTTYFEDHWGRIMPEINDYKLTSTFDVYFQPLQKIFNENMGIL